MSDESSNTRLNKIASVMKRHGVRFIVIGGQAEYIFGSPRVTYDVDFCYRRDPENLKNLAAALQELRATLRGAPKDLPFKLDARTLEMGSNFTFDTSDAGSLDMLGYVEPLGDFDRLNERATDYDVDGLSMRVIDLDDLIQVKKHINRSKDRDSLLQLMAIKQVRDETGKR